MNGFGLADWHEESRAEQQAAGKGGEDCGARGNRFLRDRFTISQAGRVARTPSTMPTLLSASAVRLPLGPFLSSPL